MNKRGHNRRLIDPICGAARPRANDSSLTVYVFGRFYSAPRAATAIRAASHHMTTRGRWTGGAVPK
jgi:hypothetical protein